MCKVNIFCLFVYSFFVIPSIIGPATTAITVKLETTTTTHKSTTKPKPSKLHDIILHKIMSIYHKVARFVKKHLGLWIFGAIGVGLVIFTITICLCRYEAMISTLQNPPSACDRITKQLFLPAARLEIKRDRGQLNVFTACT